MTNPLFDKMIEAIREAVVVVEEERFDDAVTKFDDIIQTSVIISQSLVQRGRCHWEMKRWDVALSDFELALKMEPDNYDIQWTTSLMYLQLNKFPEGWMNIDARWKSNKFDSARLKTSKQTWQPGFGKDLLVWTEQGVGDQILYCSMLNAVRKDVDELLVMADARYPPCTGDWLSQVRCRACGSSQGEIGHIRHRLRGRAVVGKCRAQDRRPQERPACRDCQRAVCHPQHPRHQSPVHKSV